MNPRLLWPLSLTLGLVMSVGLFWLMSLMVSGFRFDLDESRPSRIVEFVRLKRQQRPPPTRRQPPPPPKKEPPPPKPALASPHQAIPQPNVDIDVPTLDLPLSTRLQGSLLSGIEMAQGTGPTSAVTPLVRIPPHYPMKARRRRIEGWVKLEFTITKEGTVKDIRVVEAHPRGIFDQAAMRAISRWKFKPLIIEGTPVEQRAIQVLEFKLRK